MRNKKKIAIVSISSVAAISILATGALALFTDYDQEEAKAYGGVLDVAVNNFTFTNKNNINPGDNDTSAPKTYIPVEGDPLFNPASPGTEVSVPSTEHTIKYDITNNGNESAKIRRNFYISCLSSTGEVLDPSVFLIMDTDNNEISKKYVVDDKNNEYLVLNNVDSTPLDTVPEGTKIVTIRYFEDEKLFEGVGKGAQNEANADVENKNGISRLEQEFKFGMKKVDSGNEYQGASISVTLAVEGMQARNANSDTWETISKETIIATTSGSQFNIVYAKNSDENIYVTTTEPKEEEQPEVTSETELTEESPSTQSENKGGEE